MHQKLAALLVIFVLFIPIFATAQQTDSSGDAPVLTAELPRDIIYEGTEETADGYTETLMTSDSMASIYLLRRTGTLSAQDVLADLIPDAKDVQSAEQIPIASYPASRIIFTSGENEDTRIGTLVVVPTDVHTFAFCALVASDAYNGELNYQEMVEWWIESLDIFDGSTPTYAEPTGLVLRASLPEDAETIGAEILENGDYTQYYWIDSGIAGATIARRAADASVSDIMTELFPEADSPTNTEQEPILSYPASRYTFTSGTNEDARVGVLVLIPTDTNLFIFAVDVQADAFAEDGYQAQIEHWVRSLELIER